MVIHHEADAPSELEQILEMRVDDLLSVGDPGLAPPRCRRGSRPRAAAVWRYVSTEIGGSYGG
jgi:hypothetical protein